MRTATRTLLLLLTLAATLGACARRREPAPLDARTTLRVENNNFSDMTIYVVRSGQRVRMGLAAGNSTTTLVIPPALLSGISALRFIADPIGGRASPVTEEISVSPGDEVVLYIPPG